MSKAVIDKERVDYKVSIVEKMVKSGNSTLLKEWQKNSTVTDDEFIDAFKWIASQESDWQNYFIGLSATGIVHIKRSISNDTGISTYWNLDKDEKFWGEKFKIRCNEKQREFFGEDYFESIETIMINIYDRI